MALFGIFKGEAGYKKNVNEYRNSRLKNKDCHIDKKNKKAICNKNGRIVKYNL